MIRVQTPNSFIPDSVEAFTFHHCNWEHEVTLCWPLTIKEYLLLSFVGEKKSCTLLYMSHFCNISYCHILFKLIFCLYYIHSPLTEHIFFAALITKSPCVYWHFIMCHYVHCGFAHCRLKNPELPEPLHNLFCYTNNPGLPMFGSVEPEIPKITRLRWTCFMIQVS